MKHLGRREAGKVSKKELEQPLEGVLYVPYTHNSVLKKKMQEAERQWRGNPDSGRVRILERQGPSILDILGNPSPWVKEPCSREECQPCETKPGSCRSKGVTYRIDCLGCKEAGVATSYYGESNRTLLDRTQEHTSLLRRKADTSVLYKHWQEDHKEEEEPPTYSSNLLGRHSTALERQLKEALAIANCKVDKILNEKSEFGRNCIITSTFSYDGFEGQMRDRRQEENGRRTPDPSSSSPRRKRQRQEEPERRQDVSNPEEGKSASERKTTETAPCEERHERQRLPAGRKRTPRISQETKRNVLEDWIRGSKRHENLKK